MATTNSDPSLAQGGGNATAAGVAFQANVASYFGALLLGERAIDRLPDLGRVLPLSVRVETEAPVDDILIETTAGGFIFIQAKSSIQFASNLESPLGKTIEQFVRQWIVCTSGFGKRRWDRPLSVAADRLVLAVGPGSSRSVTQDLALALRARRAPGGALLPASQQQALNRFNDLLHLAWQRISGGPAQCERALLGSQLLLTFWSSISAVRIARSLSSPCVTSFKPRATPPPPSQHFKSVLRSSCPVGLGWIPLD
jgi:hypothetical protein